MQSTKRTALVIGVTGSIGREVAATLMGRGWQVRALHRNPAQAQVSIALPNSIQWVQGDAMQESDVGGGARGDAHRARGQPAKLPQLARTGSAHAG